MRTEQGAGTLLVSLVVALVVGLAVAVAQYAGLRAEGVRLQGAADLAAIAGAQARQADQDACAAASRSAAANVGRVVRCQVAGDEVEYVVSIALEAPASAWPVGAVGTLRAHANAGLVTGAPAEAVG